MWIWVGRGRRGGAQEVFAEWAGVEYTVAQLTQKDNICGPHLTFTNTHPHAEHTGREQLWGGQHGSERDGTAGRSVSSAPGGEPPNIRPIPCPRSTEAARCSGRVG